MKGLSFTMQITTVDRCSAAYREALQLLERYDSSELMDRPRAPDERSAANAALRALASASADIFAWRGDRRWLAVERRALALHSHLSPACLSPDMRPAKDRDAWVTVALAARPMANPDTPWVLIVGAARQLALALAPLLHAPELRAEVLA